MHQKYTLIIQVFRILATLCGKRIIAQTIPYMECSWSLVWFWAIHFLVANLLLSAVYPCDDCCEIKSGWNTWRTSPWYCMFTSSCHMQDTIESVHAVFVQPSWASCLILNSYLMTVNMLQDYYTSLVPRPFLPGLNFSPQRWLLPRRVQG